MTARTKALRLVVVGAALAAIATFALLPGSAGARPLAGSAGAGSDAPQYEGYQLVFKDDFNGAAGQGVSPGKWIYDLGTGYGCAQCPTQWGTFEIESMTDNPENVSLDGNGNLLITPVRAQDGSWTSGRIETRKFDFEAEGEILRVEASLQLPQVGSGPEAAGIWPAFWMLGEPFRANGNTGWPGIGEIDIMENINGRGTVFGVMHCGNLNEPNAAKPWLLGPCAEFDGIGGTIDVPATSLQNQFHTYRVEIDQSISPNQIRYYFDGQLFHSISESQLPAQTWEDAVDHGWFIILNVAVGGAFPWAECTFFPHPGGCNTPGAPFAQVVTPQTTSGKPMKVAYVAVYSSK